MPIPRPSSTPSWATGGGRRITPSGGEQASGFVEAMRTPAKKANWVTGLCSDWIDWLAALNDVNEEHIYQAPKTRLVYLPLMRARSSEVYVAGGTTITNVGNLRTGWRGATADPGGLHHPVTELLTLTCALEFQNTTLDIDSVLGNGNEITQIDVKVIAGTAQATSTDRILVQLVERNGNTGTRTVIASATATSSSGAQTISLSGLTVTLAHEQTVYDVIVTSSAGAASTEDEIRAVLLTYAENGSRHG